MEANRSTLGEAMLADRMWGIHTKPVDTKMTRSEAARNLGYNRGFTRVGNGGPVSPINLNLLTLLMPDVVYQWIVGYNAGQELAKILLADPNNRG